MPRRDSGWESALGAGLPVFCAAALALSFTRGTAVSGGAAQKVGEDAAAAHGYGSKEVAMVEERRSGKWTPALTDEEKQTLFAIVEETLQWCVSRSREAFSFDAYSITPKLKEETATFVTLKMRGALRGCIGSLAPVAPLYKSVHENAINASMKDFRFQPVSAAELPGLDVHISILSPIVGIGSLDEFKIGEHGIIIEKHGRRAVYLPEVAVEQGWTKEETLASLCRKAGLNADAWREGASYKVFSSVVLSK